MFYFLVRQSGFIRHSGPSGRLTCKQAELNEDIINDAIERGHEADGPM